MECLNEYSVNIQEIMCVTTVTPAGMEMVQRGMKFCKILMKCTDEIEELLTANRATIKWETAVQVLQQTATSFLALEKFLAELTALHAVYVPKKSKAAVVRKSDLNLGSCSQLTCADGFLVVWLRLHLHSCGIFFA